MSLAVYTLHCYYITVDARQDSFLKFTVFEVKTWLLMREEGRGAISKPLSIMDMRKMCTFQTVWADNENVRVF